SAGDDILAPVDLQTTTTATYSNNPSSWLIGFPTRTVTSYTNANGSKVVVGTATQKSNTLVPQDQTQFAESDRWLKKAFTYDLRGNVIRVDVSGADIATRTEVSNTNYLDFMYPQTVT